MAAAQPVLVQLQGQTQNQNRNYNRLELFPYQSTDMQMIAHFNGIVPNLLQDLVPNKIGYINNKTYVHANSTIFNTATTTGNIPEGWDATKKRATLYYFANWGSMKDFDHNDQNDYNKIISLDEQASFAPNVNNPAGLIPNLPHWADHATKTRHAQAAFLIRRRRDDVKKAFIEVAQDLVWNAILNHSGNQNLWNTLAFWQGHAATAGRVVSMMLYFIRRDPNQTPRIIKFLIGANKATFDVDALYTARANNIRVPILTTAGLEDLVPILIGHIEMCCAHTLNQVLELHIFGTPSERTKKLVRPNLGKVAVATRNIPFLEDSIPHFPCM